MSAYCQPADVRLALAPEAVAPDQSSASALPDDQIDAAITDASAQIDAALALRYTLPLPDPVPTIVFSVCRSLAAYFASLSWRRNRPLPEGSPVEARYTWATGVLAQLGNGQALLPIPAALASGLAVWNTSPDWFLLGPEWIRQPWYGPVESSEDNASPITPTIANVGVVVTPPAVPASGETLTNPFGADASITLQAGVITSVTINDVDSGETTGTFTLPADGQIVMVYEVPPIWFWIVYGGDGSGDTDGGGDDGDGGEAVIDGGAA
jgi:phage gp36-like protein